MAVRPRKLTALPTGTAKQAFPSSAKSKLIFIHGVVNTGLANTIGRRVEVSYDLEEAEALYKSLGMHIADARFRLGLDKG